MKFSFPSRTALFAVMLSFFALPALALDLAEARLQGSLGEKPDGYVTTLKAVNTRRQQEYRRISSENGQTLDVVAKLASAQIIAKLPQGAMYQSGGNWVKK
jgi:uncharacterized protein